MNAVVKNVISCRIECKEMASFFEKQKAILERVVSNGWSRLAWFIQSIEDLKNDDFTVFEIEECVYTDQVNIITTPVWLHWWSHETYIFRTSPWPATLTISQRGRLSSKRTANSVPIVSTFRLENGISYRTGCRFYFPVDIDSTDKIFPRGRLIDDLKTEMNPT